MSLGSYRRRAIEATITADMVRDLLAYDPISGSLTWKVNRGRRCCKGWLAGGWNRDRYRVKVFDVLWEAPRIIWLMQTGEWPTGDVDHEDRDPTNNGWGNLRDLSRARNTMNQKMRSNNTSGYKGVHEHPQRPGWWWAKINADGYRYDLGVYPEREMAAAAYRIAAAGMHAEWRPT